MNPPSLAPDHYIALLALELAMDGSSVTASAPVRPELFAPGTRCVRAGTLATMVDLVAGHTPNGPVGPTVDLRLEVFGTPPSTGRIHLHCRPLRVGGDYYGNQRAATAAASPDRHPRLDARYGFDLHHR